MKLVYVGYIGCTLIIIVGNSKDSRTVNRYILITIRVNYVPATGLCQILARKKAQPEDNQK